MSTVCVPHPHPCNFRLRRVYDRGWGELAFEYVWDSTGGATPESDDSLPELESCWLYELTSYADSAGTRVDGFYLPPDPPFPGWRFRDPTDGRSGPVGLECFPASQGWAWDRHKLGGQLTLPPERKAFAIVAMQRYAFHCTQCGAELPLSGSHAGPHTITRTFAPRAETREHSPSQRTPDAPSLSVWRYALTKHDRSAWLDLTAAGYAADSAGIGFGPW